MREFNPVKCYCIPFLLIMIGTTLYGICKNAGRLEVDQVTHEIFTNQDCDGNADLPSTGLTLLYIGIGLGLMVFCLFDLFIYECSYLLCRIIGSCIEGFYRCLFYIAELFR